MSLLNKLIIESFYLGREGRPEHSNEIDVWSIKLLYGNCEEDFTYYQDILHNKRNPRLDEVLEALFDEAEKVKLPFEMFCEEYGYGGDQLDRQIYEDLKSTQEKLLRLFGIDYSDFLKIVYK